MAKLVWARLAQYAGQNGNCYPAQATLATELATNERQIRRALTELVQEQFLETDTRGRAGTRYYFLWHPCFDRAELLPKRPTLPPHAALRFADDAQNNPDTDDKNPDKLSAKENQEKNQEERKHPHPQGAPHTRGGALSAISNVDAEEYIALRTRKRIWQSENGQLPRLLSPAAYAEKLRKEHYQRSLRIGDFEDLRAWAQKHDRDEETKQKLAAAKAHMDTPEGQAEAAKAAEMKERTAIESLKLKFRAWKSKNPAWSWEELASDAELWTPVVRAPHWHDIRFKWHVAPIPGRIRLALRELINERDNYQQVGT